MIWGEVVQRAAHPDLATLVLFARLLATRGSSKWTTGETLSGPKQALVNDKLRNKLIFLSVVLLLCLFKPWRAKIHKPVIDGVWLGMSGEGVIATWGEPPMMGNGGKLWSYNVARSVELNSKGEVVAVCGSTLTLDGTNIPCRTGWITKLVLGPPTEVSYGGSMGDAWVYETSDNFVLVLTVMDRYTHYEIISVSLRRLE